ncbi:hypothetical protein B0J13DRAFT_670797 [Dactylonectria estremocensis]|uniref:Uncharacterized protein n=1 Tax=Dactylonectria estremocensis TaxID=1079267 RepID=A0A9P9FFL7_9HYPO|nr:hypothetical protein B0J13DRAFT_670797 [Dactylonectria estremocensis]
MESQQRGAGPSETPPERTRLSKASFETESKAPSEGSQPPQHEHSEVPQKATPSNKTRTPLPPFAASTRPPHSGWEGSSVNMAKCDFCDLRNRNNLQKCLECQLSVCKGCFDSGILDDDSRHFLDGNSIDWDGPEKPKRGGKTARARAGTRGRGAARARGRGGRPRKTAASRAFVAEAAAKAAEAAAAASDASTTPTIASHDENMGGADHVPEQETQAGPVSGYPHMPKFVINLIRTCQEHDDCLIGFGMQTLPWNIDAALRRSGSSGLDQARISTWKSKIVEVLEPIRVTQLIKGTHPIAIGACAITLTLPVRLARVHQPSMWLTTRELSGQIRRQHGPPPIYPVEPQTPSVMSWTRDDSSSRRFQPPPRNQYTLPLIRDLDRQVHPLHNHLAPMQLKREYLQATPREPKREYLQPTPPEPLIPRLARQLEADALATHSDVPAWALDQCLTHEVARAWTRRGALSSLLREVPNGPDHTGDLFRHLLGATYHAAILLRLERQNAARQWAVDMEAYLCREGLMRPVRAEHNVRV